MNASTDLPFNGKKLGEPSDEFVAWLDVMGIQSALRRSAKIAANFVYKIHHAALAHDSNVTLYPVMDGIYACTKTRDEMKKFLSFVFRSVASDLIKTAKQEFRFVIRGAVAWGPVYHGRDLSPEASWTLDQHKEYKRQLLLGMPMVKAHAGEREAPPFGLYVDASARFADAPYPFDVWWQWYNEGDAELIGKLRTGLDAYYDWCTKNPDASGYEASRVRIHRGQASLYLRDG